MPGKAKAHKNSGKFWREKLLQKALATLRKEEGSKEHTYLDAKGYKTVGVGTNVDKWEDFSKVNWQMNGHPATLKEKRKAFNDFEMLKLQKEYGQNLSANYFKPKSNLRISNEEAEKLLIGHLEKDLAALEKYVSGFRELPFELQQVLLDIRYNTGNAGREKWPLLHEAIDRHDIADIAENVHRKDVGDARNNWAREMILSIREW